MMTPTQPDDEEADATYDGQLLTNQVGEILDIGLEEVTLGYLYDVKVSGQRSKSTSLKESPKAMKKVEISKYFPTN